MALDAQPTDRQPIHHDLERFRADLHLVACPARPTFVATRDVTSDAAAPFM